MHIEAGKIEKAMQELGFVQGALWCFGLASIAEMKEDHA